MSLCLEPQRDGCVRNSYRDPPGQETQYIYPGDSKLERYRKSTFHKFPNDASINVMKLANSGFFYTGYRDRVKCFSCGLAVENWIWGDDPTDKKWHKQSCLMALGREPRNVPDISFFFKQSQPSNSVASSSVARTSTGHSDVTNNQKIQHVTLGATGGLQASSSSSRLNELPQDYSDIYPCKSPVNPHMKARERRLETFSFGWPEGRIQATSEQIVEAGFFYLGERDRTKCWYCNGGLQNWELDDEPWTEHAKWFPRCEFLLSVKGEEFVRRITEANPHLRRPRISNPAPDIVSRVAAMGFPRTQVASALEMSKRNGMKYDRAEDLISYLLEKNGAKEEDKRNTMEQKFKEDEDVKPPEAEEKTESLKEQYRFLKRENLCKKCFKTPAIFLYEPCGHLAVCEDCVTRRCVLCKRKVEKRMRIYRA